MQSPIQLSSILHSIQSSRGKTSETPISSHSISSRPYSVNYARRFGEPEVVGKALFQEPFFPEIAPRSQAPETTLGHLSKRPDFQQPPGTGSKASTGLGAQALSTTTKQDVAYRTSASPCAPRRNLGCFGLAHAFLQHQYNRAGMLVLIRERFEGLHALMPTKKTTVGSAKSMALLGKAA